MKYSHEAVDEAHSIEVSDSIFFVYEYENKRWF